MRQVQRRAVRGAVAVAGLVLATALVGCGNFFVCDKASCTDNGSGGSTGAAGNVAYVANNVSASTSINGYTLGKTTLTATTSSPYPINLTPTAMVMSHNNGFLYVASSVTSASLVSGIYGFTVGTGGALSVLNVGNAFAALPLGASVAAMDVSPDGQWLIVSSSYSATAGASIQAYQLNATTGAVTASTSLPAVQYSSNASGASSTPVVSALKVAPSGDFISVALGTGGVITFPFATSTGAISVGTVTPFTPTGSAGAYDVAIDSNNVLYVAATGAIFVFQMSSAGAVTSTITNGIAIGSTGPFSIALDGTGYVYAGATDSTNLIYAFSNKAGVLTKLSTFTISAPTTTTKLAVDSTGAYLLAAGYDTTAGLKLYSIASGTGVLTSLDTAPTGGTSIVVPTALALSH